MIGSDQLIQYITDKPGEHIATFVALLIFTGLFYFIFAWFREQVCIIACPYGRLQGVLLDDKSVVVAYDHKRGEAENGRKKFRKNEDREALGHGDCIDCNQCVDVCPTGIDIRNGTQLECVNCTACIDACDLVMERIDLPKGLIRYASEENIQEKKKFRFTPRLKAYSAVLTVLVGILISLLFLRSSVEASVLRLPGQMYEQKDNGTISNVFTYKFVNKTSDEIGDIRVELLSHDGNIKIVKDKNEMIIPSQGMAEGTLFVEIPQALIKSNKNEIKIGIYSGDELIDETEVNFMGPRSFR